MSTVDSDLALGSEKARDVAATAPSPRAPRISPADVFAAADALLVEGHRPTIDRVRMRLGRGSPNTINDHLDAWWAKLGSRLRDLPGREFPQLPERVAQSLQQLWNEALEAAHDTLQDSLIQREQALTDREQDLESRSGRLNEREQAISARATALEESLALAREQLSAANRRAGGLETALDERDRECGRLRLRIEALEDAVTELRGKLDAAAAAHEAERTKLHEQYAASEARWLAEVDRARQGIKEAANAHDRQLKEMRGQLTQLQSERQQLRQDLLESRAELKTAAAVREQLDQRLRLTTRLSKPDSSRTKLKSKTTAKPPAKPRRVGRYSSRSPASR